MKLEKLVPFFLLTSFILFQPSISTYAAESNSHESKKRSLIPPSAQDAFLRTARLLQQKQAAQSLEAQNTDTRRGGSSATQQELTDQSPDLLASTALPSQDQTAIYNWFLQNQQANSTGLVTSYPNDPRVAQVSCGPGCTYPVNLNTQAFSYDQALSGILMLNQGDTQNVQRIFNFYYSQWQAEQTNFHGFWTTYNAQDPNGPKVEYMKITGSNAWMGIFCLQYYAKTGDTRGRDLATKIGKWIVSLPHQNGGVAMGDSDIWANLYSVENNLSYYSLVNSLSSKAATSADRNLFKTERSNLKNWLKTQAYDPTTGLFKRGTGGDTIKAFDTNSWAVLVLGVQTLKNWGINVDNLVVQTERTFGVQTNGSFGGSTLTAKGFDFSDAANAATIGRTGMKWVEGTNQMISVYKTLAYWYRGNQTKAAYYNNRANYFSSLNAQNSIPDNGSLSYYYADQSSVQIFSDNPYWSTASGAAIASTAWVYFSAGGINPFNI